MENFISSNISYLLSNKKLTQDEFGGMFDLGKGVINQYLLKKSNPKIETIQKISSYFKISIDDFINTDLSQKPFGIRDGKLLTAKEPENEDYSPISPRYVEQLEKALKDKERIIAALEESLKDKEKLIQSLENKKNQNSA